MTVRCSEYKDCPLIKCPHYEEHRPSFTLEHLGGVGPVETYCDKVSRTCGLREPWVKVKCVEVIKETAQAQRELVAAPA